MDEAGALPTGPVDGDLSVRLDIMGDGPGDGFWRVDHPFRSRARDIGLYPNPRISRAPHPREAATERLLAVAEALAALRERTDSGEEDAARSLEFSALYQEWIDRHRDIPSTPEARNRKLGLLIHCMAAGSTLGEAIEFLARFHGVVYEGGSAVDVRRDGAFVALSLGEPFKPGVHGLLSDLWPLTVVLHALEFLIGGELDGVSARVRHGACLSPKVRSVLFGAPLDHETEDLALVIPLRHLTRAVVAQPRDIPGFLGSLLPAVLARGARRPEMQSLIAGLLRNDKLRHSSAPATLESVSSRLGCGAATARRRLRAEGTRFREVRDRVFDELAKTWLLQSDLRLDVIAERLGYSDVFAFRRAFRRCNGYSPSAYRRDIAAAA